MFTLRSYFVRVQLGRIQITWADCCRDVCTSAWKISSLASHFSTDRKLSLKRVFFVAAKQTEFPLRSTPTSCFHAFNFRAAQHQDTRQNAYVFKSRAANLDNCVSAASRSRLGYLSVYLKRLVRHSSRTALRTRLIIFSRVRRKFPTAR